MNTTQGNPPLQAQLVQNTNAGTPYQQQNQQFVPNQVYGQPNLVQPQYQPQFQPQYQPHYQPQYNPQYQPKYQPQYVLDTRQSNFVPKRTRRSGRGGQINNRFMKEMSKSTDNNVQMKSVCSFLFLLL